MSFMKTESGADYGGSAELGSACGLNVVCLLDAK